MSCGEVLEKAFTVVVIVILVNINEHGCVKLNFLGKGGGSRAKATNRELGG